MASGILIIDKPQGWTSMDVCAKLRGIFHERRVGHGGTLDPMATGVLPIFLGRATRAVEFASNADKEYIAGLKLGLITNTQDITGQILEERPASVTRDALEAVLPRFQGAILQVPPMYSAIKRNGKKLYELARKGQEVERPPRPIHIYQLEVLDTTPPEGTDFLLRVACSKGTYVRTLCHDVGQALGCGGTMSLLRRTKAAGFSLTDAVTLESIQSAAAQGGADSLVLPVDSCFSNLPALSLTAHQEQRLRNGAPVTVSGLASGEYRAYGQSQSLLALCRSDGATLHTIKSFFEV